MSNDTPLTKWHFLLGKWKGGSTDPSGDEGEIVTTASFSIELGKYIMGKLDSYRHGKLESASVSMLFYDVRGQKFRRKTFFSYGYVNNEVEYERTDSEIRFNAVPEPILQAFDGLRWRSYILKVSDTEIRLGLESAKEGEDFVTYGESILHKSS